MSHIANQSNYTRRYRPRHLLAHYAVNQIATLELCSQDIVKAMGYPLKHTMPACERLRHVLSSQYLALDGSYIDKYFTPEAFLTKLFSVLEIPYTLFVADIEQIKHKVTHDQRYKKHPASSDMTIIHGLPDVQDNKTVNKVKFKRKKSSSA